MSNKALLDQVKGNKRLIPKKKTKETRQSIKLLYLRIDFYIHSDTHTDMYLFEVRII